jgi:hypothetical protein
MMEIVLEYREITPVWEVKSYIVMITALLYLIQIRKMEMVMAQEMSVTTAPIISIPIKKTPTPHKATISATPVTVREILIAPKIRTLTGVMHQLSSLISEGASISILVGILIPAMATLTAMVTLMVPTHPCSSGTLAGASI